MGRKNILMPGPAPNTADNPSAAASPSQVKPKSVPDSILKGPVGAMTNDLMRHSIREVDTSLIDESDFADRMEIHDEEIESLAESIRIHGQQVPILVRPTPENPGRYMVVYGRRRLLALKKLGLKAHALVRTLDKDKAIIAQGQENNHRRDPSFIEKAMFAKSLREAGVKPGVIFDALGIDKSISSRMKAVTDRIDDDLIRTIGAAPDAGRRRWIILADSLNHIETGQHLRTILNGEGLDDVSSDERLAMAIQAAKDNLKNMVAHGKPGGDEPAGQTIKRKLTLDDGRELGEISRSANSVSMKVSVKGHSAFNDWLEKRAEDALQRLFREWSESEGSN